MIICEICIWIFLPIICQRYFPVQRIELIQSILRTWRWSVLLTEYEIKLKWFWKNLSLRANLRRHENIKHWRLMISWTLYQRIGQRRKKLFYQIEFSLWDNLKALLNTAKDLKYKKVNCYQRCWRRKKNTNDCFIQIITYLWWLNLWHCCWTWWIISYLRLYGFTIWK